MWLIFFSAKFPSHDLKSNEYLVSSLRYYISQKLSNLPILLFHVWHQPRLALYKELGFQQEILWMGYQVKKSEQVSSKWLLVALDWLEWKHRSTDFPNRVTNVGSRSENNNKQTRHVSHVSDSKDVIGFSVGKRLR